MRLRESPPLSGILTGRNKGYTGSVSPSAAIELSRRSADAQPAAKRSPMWAAITVICSEGTVRDNLLMGDPDAYRRAALGSAGTSEPRRISSERRKRAGYAAIAGKSVSNLSGGQCQRLALARALIARQPRFIFLTRPPPTLTWKAKTILWSKSTNWQKQKPSF